jgi:hypothetical protein
VTTAPLMVDEVYPPPMPLPEFMLCLACDELGPLDPDGWPPALCPGCGRLGEYLGVDARGAFTATFEEWCGRWMLDVAPLRRR